MLRLNSLGTKKNVFQTVLQCLTTTRGRVILRATSVRLRDERQSHDSHAKIVQ